MLSDAAVQYVELVLAGLHHVVVVPSLELVLAGLHHVVVVRYTGEEQLHV